MYTIDDIQIFIATHNRADFLKESIESILNQTAGVKRITVLDNESTDNTEDVVSAFSHLGVKYVRTYGFLGNFEKAREIVDKLYCMLFHDDDLLHPQYLEFALKILNKYENVSLITTRSQDFFDYQEVEFKKEISKKHYVFNSQKDFAKHMYFIGSIAYASAIYNTKSFLNTDLEYEKFSKFNDWPFMVKMAAYGKTVLLDEKNMFLVRRHAGQDTWTYDYMPTLEQIVNWDVFFFDAMKLKNNKYSLLQIMFNYQAWNFMEVKYSTILSPEYKKDHTLDELKKIAFLKNIFPVYRKRWPFFVRKLSKTFKWYMSVVLKKIVFNV